MEYPHNRPYTADDLVRIITLLRDPVNGCPWDKVQTHTSIRMNFLEEAYEAVDALDLDDPVLMCEELGDVLMRLLSIPAWNRKPAALPGNRSAMAYAKS